MAVDSDWRRNSAADPHLRHLRLLHAQEIQQLCAPLPHCQRRLRSPQTCSGRAMRFVCEEDIPPPALRKVSVESHTILPVGTFCCGTLSIVSSFNVFLPPFVEQWSHHIDLRDAEFSVAVP